MMLMMISQTPYNHLPQPQHTTDDGAGKGDDGYHGGVVVNDDVHDDDDDVDVDGGEDDDYDYDKQDDYEYHDLEEEHFIGNVASFDIKQEQGFWKLTT